MGISLIKFSNFKTRNCFTGNSATGNLFVLIPFAEFVADIINLVEFVGFERLNGWKLARGWFNNKAGGSPVLVFGLVAQT